MSVDTPTTSPQYVNDNNNDSFSDKASHTPFLDAAGIEVDFKRLRADPTAMSDIPRVTSGTIFNNGMVLELEQHGLF